MNNQLDDEADWLGTECITAEQCPIEGFWEQVETGRIDWHQTDETFPELKKIPYQRATYRYIGKKKDR